MYNVFLIYSLPLHQTLISLGSQILFSSFQYKPVLFSWSKNNQQVSEKSDWRRIFEPLLIKNFLPVAERMVCRC